MKSSIGDSLRREDLAPSAPPKKVLKLRMMWCVAFKEKRGLPRLLTAAQAKKLAYRFNRLHKVDYAYATRFGYVRL